MNSIVIFGLILALGLCATADDSSDKGWKKDVCIAELTDANVESLKPCFGNRTGGMGGKRGRRGKGGREGKEGEGGEKPEGGDNSGRVLFSINYINIF